MDNKIELGFGTFCSTADGQINTNHTFKIHNLSLDKVLRTFELNLNDLFKLLDLCVSENIEVLRLGSSFVPYASHGRFQEAWLDVIDPLLTEAGKKIRKYKVRITMHPGQFVVLNSPNIEVVERSIRELEYHFWVLDKLGIGDDGVVIVHVGGSYSNKQKAIDRFINNVEKNSWLKRRLAVENDERLFNAMDVLHVCRTLKVPFVFDYLHHSINPSEVRLKEIFDILDIQRGSKGSSLFSWKK